MPLDELSFVREVSRPATNSVSPERSRAGNSTERDSRSGSWITGSFGPAIGGKTADAFDARRAYRYVQAQAVGVRQNSWQYVQCNSVLQFSRHQANCSQPFLVNDIAALEVRRLVSKKTPVSGVPFMPRSTVEVSLATWEPAAALRSISEMSLRSISSSEEGVRRRPNRDPVSSLPNSIVAVLEPSAFLQNAVEVETGDGVCGAVDLVQFHVDQHLGSQFPVCSDYPLVYPAKGSRCIDYIKFSGLTVERRAAGG